MGKAAEEGRSEGSSLKRKVKGNDRGKVRSKCRVRYIYLLAHAVSRLIFCCATPNGVFRSRC
ncbi:hypothetical protein K505DRAFT_134457 [Melanomma pulvis-pyrius CBS 109.77]|uniref:Uncharacterized protein n=1 Tax=Melanomma pulvis-pyrius CBS 109.77 TaxID=1314802 RepID=A0A6A6WT19_9PLEO|nr:hypothetical protein K505DRAFT_134457 [Melanomma pulvis-pyrius CBS 109.77]